MCMIYDTIRYMIYDMIRYDKIWFDMMWYDIWYDMIWYICQLQLGWYPVAVLQYTFTQTIQRITQWNRVHRIHRTALRASNHSMDILNASRFWQPSAATALYHTRRSHHSVVSSWWWAWNCPKHVEQFIKRNKVLHKVTSSWFCYLHWQRCVSLIIRKTTDCHVLIARSLILMQSVPLYVCVCLCVFVSVCIQSPLALLHFALQFFAIAARTY